MEVTTQDPSGATDKSVSDGVQQSSTQTQTETLSKSDTVAYETHKKLLGEKKRVQSQLEEMQTKLNSLTEEKLSAEGKKDELLEAYKKRLNEMESKVQDFAYTSVSNSVRMKAKEMGCVDDEVVVKLIDLTKLSVGEGFTVDPDEVRTMLESVKKEKSYLFKPQNPNVNNSIPNANPNVEGGKIDFSKMTKEELVAYGKRSGL